MAQYIITYTNTRTNRASYWQTPWVSRIKIMGQDGKPVTDELGKHTYATNPDGSVQWKEIGGWVSRPEWATLYRNQKEAEGVNAIRGLDANVEVF